MTRSAAYGLELGFTVAFLYLLGKHVEREPSGNHMISEHLREGILVLGLKKRLDRSVGKVLESVIGRGEYCERARAFERLDQSRRLHSLDESRVLRRIDRVVNYILLRIHRFSADHNSCIGKRGHPCNRKNHRCRRQRQILFYNIVHFCTSLKFLIRIFIREGKIFRSRLHETFMDFNDEQRGTRVIDIYDM